jgi:excisionase family DNA binding protein
MKKQYTTKEAAAELGVSIRRVQALIAAGRLKTTRFGQAHQIDRDDLDQVRERRPGYPAGRKRNKSG